MFQQKVSSHLHEGKEARRHLPILKHKKSFSQFHEINALQKYSNLPHIREFLQAQNGPAPSNGMVNLPPYQSYESALK